MERGGESWRGWRFGPYGRARDWRLHAPTGETYTPGEISQNHRESLELVYAVSRIRQLEALLIAKPAGLTPRERLILQQAAEIMARTGDAYQAAQLLQLVAK